MKHFTYMLAPLEQTGDNALRTLCYTHGADLTFTEMTRWDSLAKRNKSSWNKIHLHDTTPTVIQIAGTREDTLKKFLTLFQPTKGFKGFNINLGCPSPHVIKQGAGCALIKRTTKIQKYLDIITKQGYECSLKIRLGMNQQEKEHHVYLNLLKNTQATYYIIHARHGKEHYETPADMNIYQECTEQGKTIIANGDISTKEHAQHLQQQGVRGVMIGRAAVYNPSIFATLKGKAQTPFAQLTKEYLQLTQHFHTPQSYQQNVLSRLGNQQNLIKKKYQLTHIQG